MCTYVCTYVHMHTYNKLKEQSTPHLLEGPRWLENQESTSKVLVNRVSSEDLHPGRFEMTMDLQTHTHICIYTTVYVCTY